MFDLLLLLRGERERVLVLHLRRGDDIIIIERIGRNTEELSTKDEHEVKKLDASTLLTGVDSMDTLSSTMVTTFAEKQHSVFMKMRSVTI
jgi:hypothetical protein